MCSKQRFMEKLCRVESHDHFSFLQDPYVQMYLSVCDREIRHLGRQSFHTNFSLDHPIEEVGRLLSATLLRHTHLTPQLIEVLEQGKMLEMVKMEKFSEILLTALLFSIVS